MIYPCNGRASTFSMRPFHFHLHRANLMTVEELEAMTADRPMTAEQAAIIMLQCPSRHFVAAD